MNQNVPEQQQSSEAKVPLSVHSAGTAIMEHCYASVSGLPELRKSAKRTPLLLFRHQATDGALGADHL